jgi:DNA helicase-2/ATP-dependent DNA helicase PcrA
MLSRAIELLQLPSARRQLVRLYGHVIVDEAQNLTRAQYELLTALIGSPDGRADHLPAMVVGDEKQSIVSFAGADPTLMLRFEHDYRATRFKLSQNFRSAASIAAIGDSVAQHLAQPALGMRTTSYALAPGEGAYVRAEDIAVLARSAASLRPTREALERVDVPVAVASTPDDWVTTISAKLILELVALRSAAEHRSTQWQLARLLGTDERAVGDINVLAGTLLSSDDEMLCMLAPLCSIGEPATFITALAHLEIPSGTDGPLLAAWEADCRQIVDAWRSFVAQADVVEQTWGNFRLHIARLQRGDAAHVGVRLLTIHKAQGREFRVVVLLGLNDGQLPDFRANTSEERLSELRTFYVAVTRASRLLLVTRASTRETRYGWRMSNPSPYWEFVRSAS